MNHALTPQQLLDAMRASPLFAQLFPDEFRGVVGLLQVRRAAAGETIVHEGDMDGALYVLRRGRLNARRAGAARGSRPIVRVHLPGDILNEEAFVTGCAAQWTLEAPDDAELWVAPAEDFRALLRKFGDIDARLGRSTEEPDAREATVVSMHTQFEGQRAGEKLQWSGRSHRLLFLARAWLGWLLTAAAIAATLIAAAPAAPAALDSATAALVRVAVFIAGVAVAAWHYLDWRNDIYVVSDQRVLHRERVLMLIDRQNECPIDKVQNVRVDRPTWLNTLLDIGHITIEAQGARAAVDFRWVRHPDEAARIVLGSAGRVREHRAASEKDGIRQALHEALHPESAPSISTQDEQQAPAATSIDVSTLMRIYRWFIPPMREKRGDDVVYHKHWLLLLRTTIAPLLLFAASVGLQLVVPQLGWTAPAFIAPHVLQLIGVAASLALLGRWIWRYEDWRNDVYIIMSDRVIDFDRSPFGFAGTRQKTAGMQNIQNVAYRTHGILDNLFNMGDVVIQTGGADGELVFERIWNPRAVQREIIDRIDAYQRRQQQSQQNARRRELTEWLTAYDQIRKQS